MKHLEWENPQKQKTISKCQGLGDGQRNGE